MWGRQWRQIGTDKRDKAKGGEGWLAPLLVKYRLVLIAHSEYTYTETRMLVCTLTSHAYSRLKRKKVRKRGRRVYMCMFARTCSEVATGYVCPSMRLTICNLAFMGVPVCLVVVRMHVLYTSGLRQRSLMESRAV